MKKITLISLLLGVLACADMDDNLLFNNGSVGLNGGPQGPKGDKGASAHPLAGEWKLEAYENGKVSKSTVLEFKTQRNLSGNYILSGISAVNFYEAGYEIGANNTLKIVHLSMTEIGGPPADMAFENNYFERLALVNSYSFKDKTLILKNTKGQEMHFK